MSTSTASNSNPLVAILTAIALVPKAASDPFHHRQRNVTGHDQEELRRARFLFAGAGGINSWAVEAFARAGATDIAICDADSIDATNLARQNFHAEQVGMPKASSLASNIQPLLFAGGRVTAFSMTFEQAIAAYPIGTDVILCGVDNNAGRLAVSRFARARQIPAVFSMLSPDGMRCHCFLQGPAAEDACLWCALPDLDPAQAAFCDAGAILASCFLVNAYALFFTYRALMGWPGDVEPFNWREGNLLGTSPDRIGRVARRSDCIICSNPM